MKFPSLLFLLFSFFIIIFVDCKVWRPKLNADTTTTAPRENISDSNTLPDAFYGTFVMYDTVNFKEFLTCQGYPERLSDFYINSNFTKAFTRTESNTKFNFADISEPVNSFWPDIELGKPFETYRNKNVFKEVEFIMYKGALMQFEEYNYGSKFSKYACGYEINGDVLHQVLKNLIMCAKTLIFLLIVGITYVYSEGVAVNPAGAASSAAVIAAAAATDANTATHNVNVPLSPATSQRATRSASDILPEKFFGKFDLDHSENFDEYLTAKGYGWFTRKLVTFATFKKVFAKTGDKHSFDYSNLTSKKDVFYKNVQIGKKFEGEGLDSTKHEITFTLTKDGHLFEHHKPLEEGEAKEETYEYYFDGDWLLQKMSFNGVEGRRYYKKIE
uniref:FABP domain-containing protein n=1 Tax=Caenorhabditis tropicalis TaxID=1561998 RepID=A0A1I7UAG4_9PELO